MNWIKIKDGCEMPNVSQEVIVLTESQLFGHKYKTLYLASIDEGGDWIETTDSQGIGVVTHWAKVDLPDGE